MLEFCLPPQGLLSIIPRSDKLLVYMTSYNKKTRLILRACWVFLQSCLLTWLRVKKLKLSAKTLAPWLIGQVLYTEYDSNVNVQGIFCLGCTSICCQEHNIQLLYTFSLDRPRAHGHEIAVFGCSVVRGAATNKLHHRSSCVISDRQPSSKSSNSSDRTMPICVRRNKFPTSALIYTTN